MTQPIFLIGPRGCGKTTIGHVLARAFQFSDTDHRLQAHETHVEIVQKGLGTLRELETLSLKAVTLPDTVMRPRKIFSLNMSSVYT